MEQVIRTRNLWDKIPDSLQCFLLLLVVFSVGTPFILLMQRITTFILSFLPDSFFMIFIALPIGGVLAVLAIVAGICAIIIALASIVMVVKA